MKCATLITCYNVTKCACFTDQHFLYPLHLIHRVAVRYQNKANYTTISLCAVYQPTLPMFIDSDCVSFKLISIGQAIACDKKKIQQQRKRSFKLKCLDVVFRRYDSCLCCCFSKFISELMLIGVEIKAMVRFHFF